MLFDFYEHELAVTSSKEVKGEADEAVEGGLTVMDETVGSGTGRLWTGWRFGSA